jgi:hypothetical protein
MGAAHMHNTRGLGLANCLAAFDVGVTTFDSSQGGLGGCPYAPGASGNVVTEDLVFMFEAMGVSTGVDLDQLMAARVHLQAGLPHVRVVSSGERGMPPLQVEAAAFAWLARQTILGLPGNLPKVTGAQGARILGGVFKA